MLAALKDLLTVIAVVVVLAYSTGQREWLWKQITAVRQIAQAEASEDWGCPSIFSKNSCHSLESR